MLIRDYVYHQNRLFNIALQLYGRVACRSEAIGINVVHLIPFLDVCVSST